MGFGVGLVVGACVGVAVGTWVGVWVGTVVGMGASVGVGVADCARPGVAEPQDANTMIRIARQITRTLLFRMLLYVCAR